MIKDKQIVPAPEKTEGDDLPTKRKGVNAVDVGFAISAVLKLLEKIVPDLIPPAWKANIAQLLLALFIFFLLLWLEDKTTGDFLGLKLYWESKQKTAKQTSFYILKILLFSYIALTFLFAPWLPENIRLWKSRKADVPPTNVTMETAGLIGSTITDTPNLAVETSAFPTLTNMTSPNPTNTPTPSLASTLKPTSTSTLYQYKIGVFAQNSENCTKADENQAIVLDLDKNDEIIRGLQKLGFNATEVAVTSENDYYGYDVLYMPYGWSCTYLDYDLDSIRNFLKREGTGLLVGDPRPDVELKFSLLASDLKYSPLTNETVNNQEDPTIDYIWKGWYVDTIFRYAKSYDYPVAESQLEILDPDRLTHYVGLRHQDTWYPSFVNSSMDSAKPPRFVIMPGSEYSVSEHAIPGELMKNIILWLAHEPINQ